MGVQAIFTSGESQRVEKEVTIVSSESDRIDKVVCYPNPARENLCIDGDVRSVKVINLQGSVVFHAGISGKNPYIIDVSKWNNGIYFLIIETGNRFKIEKVIKL